MTPLQLIDEAYAHIHDAQFSLAEARLIEAQRKIRETDEPEPLLAAVIANGLGVVYKYTGRVDEAEPLYRQALDVFETEYGPDSLQTADIYHNLGGLAHARREYAAGEADAAGCHHSRTLPGT